MEECAGERSSTASTLDFIITAKRAALVEAGFPLKINTTRAKTMTTFKKVFPDMLIRAEKDFSMYVLAKA